MEPSSTHPPPVDRWERTANRLTATAAQLLTESRAILRRDVDDLGDEDFERVADMHRRAGRALARARELVDKVAAS